MPIFPKDESTVSRLRRSIQSQPVENSTANQSGEEDIGSGLLGRRMGRTNNVTHNESVDADAVPVYSVDEIVENKSKPAEINEKQVRKKQKNTEASYKAADENSDSMPDSFTDGAAYQSEVDAEDMSRRFDEQVREKRRMSLTRICQGFLIVMSVYLAFLIYGAIVTNYEYNKDGIVTAQRMSVAELEAAAEYRSVQSYYIRARELYEEALTLDYRLACYPEDALIIASDYETMLEKVAKLSIDLNAANFSSGYNQLQKQLMNWVQTDIAVYLQNVSAAITQNNSEKANNAIISRDVMYNDFMLISENIAVYGRNTKGVSLGDIYEWSPEKYVKEELEGLREDA
jgi:hypothetical protein